MMCSSTTIESLPQEVLLHVFSYLEPRFLCETVAQVCNYWEDLSNDPLLYKTLNLRGYLTKSETAIKLLRRAPLLKKLVIAEFDNMNTILEEVSQHNHKIRELVLANSFKQIVIQSPLMEKIVKNCSGLEKLSLVRCPVRSSVPLENICLPLNHLKSLHLHSIEDINHDKNVINLVNSCSVLEDLLIYQRHWDCEVNIEALCGKFCKTLSSLKIYGGIWTREGFSALQKLDRLETFGIGNSHSLSHEGLPFVALIPNLRHLELWRCEVPETIWMRLFTSGDWTNLLSLDLIESDVTDEACVVIGDRLKNLQSVGLCGIHRVESPTLTAKGVKSIIKGCSKIDSLRLHNLWYTHAEVFQFIPENLPGLKLLSMDPDADVQEAIVTKLKSRMPDLELDLEW